MDTVKILQEVRSSMPGLPGEERAPAFDEIPIVPHEAPARQRAEDLGRAVSGLCENWDVSPCQPLDGTGVKLFVKKAIRKLVRPSFRQNFDRQREFNRNAIEAVKCLEERLSMLEGRS